MGVMTYDKINAQFCKVMGRFNLPGPRIKLMLIPPMQLRYNKIGFVAVAEFDLFCYS